MAAIANANLARIPDEYVLNGWSMNSPIPENTTIDGTNSYNSSLEIP